MIKTEYAVSSHLPTESTRRVHAKMLELVRKMGPTSVLEVGAGSGILGDRISNLGIRYCGIEPDAKQWGLCKENFPHLSVVNASCYDDPESLDLGKYELVISNDVIEHLYLPRELVRFKKAHLHRNGKIMTCTPNFGSYWKNLAYSIFNRWDYVHGPLWDGGHIKFFSKRTLRRIFEDEGCELLYWGSVPSVRFRMISMSIIGIFISSTK